VATTSSVVRFALGTSVVLQERDDKGGDLGGGLGLRVVAGAVDGGDGGEPGGHGGGDRVALALGLGSAKSGSAVPMMIRAAQWTLGSCSAASAPVDLKVFMNSAIRPGSVSLARIAAM